MLGKLLASLGLGQDDLENVFTQTLDRLTSLEVVTAESRKGQSQAILFMLDVLRDEDVMTSDTKKKLENKLRKWIAQNTPEAKK